MSRSGVNLSVSRLQCIGVAALVAIALALAVVPPPEGAASDPGPGRVRQKAPAPAVDTPKPADPPIRMASIPSVRSARPGALLSPALGT